MVAGDPFLVSTFQEPEGQEGRRRAHRLPLKTVSSICNLIDQNSSIQSPHRCKGYWQTWSVFRGEVCPAKCEVNWRAKWRMDIWWARSSLWYRSLLAWDTNSMTTFDFYPSFWRKWKTDPRRVPGPYRNSSHLVFKCNLLHSAFLGSSFCLSLYEPSKHLILMQGFYLAS